MSGAVSSSFKMFSVSVTFTGNWRNIFQNILLELSQQKLLLPVWEFCKRFRVSGEEEEGIFIDIYRERCLLDQHSK